MFSTVVLSSKDGHTYRTPILNAVSNDETLENSKQQWQRFNQSQFLGEVQVQSAQSEGTSINKTLLRLYRCTCGLAIIESVWICPNSKRTHQ